VVVVLLEAGKLWTTFSSMGKASLKLRDSRHSWRKTRWVDVRVPLEESSRIIADRRAAIAVGSCGCNQWVAETKGDAHATYYPCTVCLFDHKVDKLWVVGTDIPKLDVIKLIQKLDRASKVLRILRGGCLALVSVAIYPGAQDP
jgi:hypothetical protein